MIEIISITIASIALILSIITAWLTFLRKGQLKMTQPTVVFFGPDGNPNDQVHNKVFLRTFLYSSSKRGQVVESMHIRLERGETKQNFCIWVYGENDLHRGSGLYVPETGVSYNHHFLLPPDGSNFTFLPGDYILRIFANIINRKKLIELSSIKLTITKEQADYLSKGKTGIYFDWGPDRGKYYSHIRDVPDKDFTEMFLDSISKNEIKRRKLPK